MAEISLDLFVPQHDSVRVPVAAMANSGQANFGQAYFGHDPLWP